MMILRQTACRLRPCFCPLSLTTIEKLSPSPQIPEFLRCKSKSTEPFNRWRSSTLLSCGLSQRPFTSPADRNPRSPSVQFDGSDTDDMAEIEWEEEEEVEPQIGDGGDGGGIVLADVNWGQLALSVAQEVLLQHFREGDIAIYAFKVSPRGYIYVRLDKLTNQYGCPDMEEIEKYNNLYKKRLDELGEIGELPTDLAVEVSSSGAERLLKVPEYLGRFKGMPMRVEYVESDSGPDDLRQKVGVFMLDSVDEKAGKCVWKLADVKENKGLLGRGRPLSRKQRDWRIKLPYSAMNKVMLYLN